MICSRCKHDDAEIFITIKHPGARPIKRLVCNPCFDVINWAYQEGGGDGLA